MVETLIVMGRRVKKVTIESQEEYDDAASEGTRRTQECIEKGIKNRVGTSRSMISDEDAAVGEYVASLATGKAWTGRNNFKGDDLEGGFEVKTSKKPDGRLRVEPNVRPGLVHILVTPTDNHLVWIVQGWITAEEAWKLAPKDDPGNRGLPIHLVPQYLLNGMDTLPEKGNTWVDGLE